MFESFEIQRVRRTNHLKTIAQQFHTQHTSFNQKQTQVILSGLSRIKKFNQNMFFRKQKIKNNNINCIFQFKNVIIFMIQFADRSDIYKHHVQVYNVYKEYQINPNLQCLQRISNQPKFNHDEIRNSSQRQ